jgi:hypothetical protein
MRDHLAPRWAERNSAPVGTDGGGGDGTGDFRFRRAIPNIPGDC